MAVTVCHYPPDCSKWNPIKHPLFGPISLTWAGQPLHIWEALLALIRSATTTRGLEGTYDTGVLVLEAETAILNLTAQDVCPSWNYTIHARPKSGKYCLTSP